MLSQSSRCWEDLPADVVVHLLDVAGLNMAGSDLLSFMFTCKKNYKIVFNAKPAWANASMRLLKHLRGERFIPREDTLAATLSNLNLSDSVSQSTYDSDRPPRSCVKLLNIQKNWREGNYTLKSYDPHQTFGLGLCKLGPLYYVGGGDGRMSLLELSDNGSSFTRIKVASVL